MKNVNTKRTNEKTNEAAILAQRTDLIDFIGQTVANNYATPVYEFTKPNLMIEIGGQQYAITVVARDDVGRDGGNRRLDPVEANATFEPEKA